MVYIIKCTNNCKFVIIIYDLQITIVCMYVYNYTRMTHLYMHVYCKSQSRFCQL